MFSGMNLRVIASAMPDFLWMGKSFKCTIMRTRPLSFLNASRDPGYKDISKNRL